MMSMSGTTSHGGPEVVFEVVVTTDKPDYIASRESNATSIKPWYQDWK